MITREFLKSLDLFRDLQDGDAASLAGLGREEVFRKGEVVFRERDAANKVYVVMSGVVEVTKGGTGGGKPAVLARLERGEVLGEVAAFDGGPRSATAAAAVVPETRLAVWGIPDFRRFLSERPAAAASVSAALLRKLSARLRQTSEAVHTLLRAIEGSPP